MLKAQPTLPSLISKPLPSSKVSHISLCSLLCPLQGTTSLVRVSLHAITSISLCVLSYVLCKEQLDSCVCPFTQSQAYLCLAVAQWHQVQAVYG